MRRKLRILVVEDEALLAETLSDLLQDAGFEVAGPAHTVPSALDVIRSSIIDAAILDVRLFDELSYPVAYALEARSIPFLFLTAQRRLDLPPELQRYPFIEKPFHAAAIRHCLRELLAVTAKA